ncbi:MAG: hypothetical protein IPK72_16275 [Candidatus Eisenbacteria bacterium]|nr:hypothetical protein [Candidatus Eisenbacteria bacterium]
MLEVTGGKLELESIDEGGARGLPLAESLPGDGHVVVGVARAPDIEPADLLLQNLGQDGQRLAMSPLFHLKHRVVDLDHDAGEPILGTEERERATILLDRLLQQSLLVAEEPEVLVGNRAIGMGARVEHAFEGVLRESVLAFMACHPAEHEIGARPVFVMILHEACGPEQRAAGPGEIVVRHVDVVPEQVEQAAAKGVGVDQVDRGVDDLVRLLTGTADRQHDSEVLGEGQVLRGQGRKRAMNPASVRQERCLVGRMGNWLDQPDLVADPDEAMAQPPLHPARVE